MSFFLAVDAGGTKTEYLLADETQELARVRSGTIKRMRADAATAAHHLDAGLAELQSLTGISLQQVRATCIGAAGFSVPLVADWLRAEFAARVSGSLILIGDVEIALDAAFQGGPGIVAIAGTGSNVAGRDLLGTVSTVGGWGPALSDQASGHRVGLQALRALFLALDEGCSTTLLEAVLDRWSLSDANHLVEFANRLPAPDFSELAPVVVTCAEAGDDLARSVLRTEADDLAHLVRLMIARLRRTSSTADWLPEIAFAGSMLEHVPHLRDSLVLALQRDLPHLKVRDGVVDPLLGALWRAHNTALSPNDLH